jgi:hypothetical protein
VGVRAAPGSEGTLLAFSDAVPGVMGVALASAEPISGRRNAVLHVDFEGLGSRPQRHAVRLVSLVFDEVPVLVGVP